MNALKKRPDNFFYLLMLMATHFVLAYILQADLTAKGDELAGIELTQV